MLHPIVQNKIIDVIEILKLHHVKRAYIFGSACTDAFTPTSDVDLLIAFDKTLRPLQRLRWKVRLYALREVTRRTNEEMRVSRLMEVRLFFGQ